MPLIQGLKRPSLGPGSPAAALTGSAPPCPGPLGCWAPSCLDGGPEASSPPLPGTALGLPGSVAFGIKGGKLGEGRKEVGQSLLHHRASAVPDMQQVLP